MEMLQLLSIRWRRESHERGKKRIGVNFAVGDYKIELQSPINKLPKNKWLEEATDFWLKNDVYIHIVTENETYNFFLL